MRARGRKTLAVFVVLDVVATLVARARGYGVGGNTVVRCWQGHLFTTLWIPGASLKALRLGWWRIQRCPVGRHWTVVTPVKESLLNWLQRRRATRHDLPLP
jgi:hypothetical protein